MRRERPQVFNHSTRVVTTARQTNKCFVESTMVSAYVWNIIPIDITAIPRIIPAIDMPLLFLMNTSLANVPEPVDNVAAES